MIKPEWEDDLYKYTTGIIQNRGHELLAINGMPDHIHIFIGFLPRDSVSDLVREVKKSTTQFIRDKIIFRDHFNGKIDMLYFQTADPMFIVYVPIFKIRKPTTQTSDLKMSVCIC